MSGDRDMKPNSQNAAGMSPKPATAKRKFLRHAAPVLVALFATLSSVGHADVLFPSMPMQTGVSQPAPNIIFILDDSLSMEGDDLDTGLSFDGLSNRPSGADWSDIAAYPRNALAYNPAITYEPWAYANTTDTDVERRPAAVYGAAYESDSLITGTTTNLGNSVQTFYVPKTSNSTLADKAEYYRYQIRSTSTGGQVVRAEWVNQNNDPTWTSSSWTNQTANANNWNNGGGNGSASSTNAYYVQVPNDATRFEVTTSGTLGNNRNPGIYVNVGNNVYPNRNAPTYSANNNGNNQHESLTIENPPPGRYYVGVFNHGSSNMTGLTVTARYTTSQDLGLGCTASNGRGWKNCTVTTPTGRSEAAEKQNYANWYQYHRTRIKAAKAGGSEAFASLDRNFRVGVMGLYPVNIDNNRVQQVLGGSAAGAAPNPANDNAGNLNNVIPVENNFGMFVGENRQRWFNFLQGMKGVYTTPLRKGLDAAGKYFSTSRAYRAVGIGPDGVTTQTSYLACRQNFAILTTDGYWNNINGDNPDSDFTSLSGDDKTGDWIYLPGREGSTAAADRYRYEKLPPYWYSGLGDYNDGTTLADVAMHYWKTDLRPRNAVPDVDGAENGSTRNVVPTSARNPAFWQHMVTFGVGLGVQGQLNSAQLSAAQSGTSGAYWPSLDTNTSSSGVQHNTSTSATPGAYVDDLAHAALNGHGEFINARDARQFTDGIKNALAQIGARRGSASNVLANSTSFSAGSRIYQATYTSGNWSGQLLSRVATSAGVTAQEWEASGMLPAAASRNIIGNDGTNVGTFPTPAQSAALGTAAATLFPTSNPLVDGAVLGNYLRGVQSREVQNNNPVPARPLRARSGLLGDIVNSSPVYVADNSSIFVGANDGMLHGFRSDTGVEVFAYVPKGVSLARLAELAHPDYGSNDTNNPHRHFVDGPVVVSSYTQTPGNNYLIGALGRGGWGLFGLDVSSPGTFDAGDVLWDESSSTPITTGDYANMGQVLGDPLVVTLNNGVKAALVANGVNSSSGAASMFVLNLQTGAIIKEFVVDNAGDNGLFAVRGANLDGGAVPNQTVDYAYAGDLKGNVWKFDLSSSDPNSWKHIKLFSAVGPDGPQPITGGLALARHPFNDTDGDGQNDVWVFFGTGRFLTEDDRSSVDVQSIYGIVDTGNFGSTGFDPNTHATTALYTRTNLDDKDIVASGTSNGRYVRSFESYQANVPAGKQGWYLDLGEPTPGERVVVNPQLDGTVLNVVSIVPPNDANTNSCEAGGIGYVNALNPWSGTGTEQPYLGVNQPSNTFTDTDGNTHQIDSVRVDEGMPSAPVLIGDTMFLNTSSAEIVKIDVNPPTGGQARRISWRELLRDD